MARVIVSGWRSEHRLAFPSLLDRPSRKARISGNTNARSPSGGPSPNTVWFDYTMPNRHISRMELKHLRYFVAAVEERSVQRAAELVNVAQPALSRRIRDLEAMLGCDLLVRGPRGVTPTGAGLSLYKDALNILAAVGQAGHRARRLGLEEGREVRMGVVQTARKYGFIQQALARYNAGHPGAGVALTRASSRDLAAALRDDRLDATLLYERRIGVAGCRDRLIHKERYVLAAHPDHPLAVAGPAPLSALAGVPLVWVLRRDNANNHDPVMQQCRLQGLEPVVGQWANSSEELVDLVVLSGGVCITPASSIFSIPPGQLVLRPLADFRLELDLTLAWARPSSSAGPIQGLLDHLHRAIDGHQTELMEQYPPWATLDGIALFRVEREADLLER